MIVRELIKHLQQYDGALEVVVRDYEGGWTKVSSWMIYISAIIKMKKHQNEWYWGDYEESEKGIPALFIDYEKEEEDV